MSAPKNRDSENTVVERDAQDTGTTATATTADALGPEQKVDADLITERAEQEQKARRRAVVGLFVGVLLAILVYAIFPADAADVVNKAHPDAEKGPFDADALRITAAIAVLMGAWWMTEALPLAATALVPLVAFPILGVVPFKEVSPSYANPTIFLFMGGFILALGMQRWNLHRRLALRVVTLVGTKPKQMVLGFMIATGFMSMWVSNTATAVVMLPIGMSVLGLTADMVGGFSKQKKFSTALMLGIAYSASIGSLGTIIGTPPNTLMVAYLQESHDIHIGFGQWMLVGVPMAAVFMVLAWLVLITVFKPEMDQIPGGRELIQEELEKMGAMSRAEKTAGTIFLLAALAWVFVPVISDWAGWEHNIDDATIAITAAILMYMLPADGSGSRVMDWEHTKEVPWGVLLLFGGGLALSSMFDKSGLSLWIGEVARGLGGLPIVLLIAATAIVILVLTEFTSNTATAAAFLPIMGGVAVGTGLTAGNDMNVLLLTVPVALAATSAFMLPVATPPNAIAYGSGYVRIGDMVRGGLWLNLLGIVLITIVTFALAVPVFGLTL